jgi:hypothetical protein
MPPTLRGFRECLNRKSTDTAGLSNNLAIKRDVDTETNPLLVIKREGTVRSRHGPAPPNVSTVHEYPAPGVRHRRRLPAGLHASGCGVGTLRFSLRPELGAAAPLWVCRSVPETEAFTRSQLYGRGLSRHAGTADGI